MRPSVMGLETMGGRARAASYNAKEPRRQMSEQGSLAPTVIWSGVSE